MSFSKRQWLFPSVITIHWEGSLVSERNSAAQIAHMGVRERARNPSYIRLHINSVRKQVPTARPIHVAGYVLH